MAGTVVETGASSMIVITGNNYFAPVKVMTSGPCTHFSSEGSKATSARVTTAWQCMITPLYTFTNWTARVRRAKRKEKSTEINGPA